MKVDTIMWAIKNLDTGAVVGNKWSRTLWSRKPTNALNSITWKYDKRGAIKLNLKCIKVRITEVAEDE